MMTDPQMIWRFGRWLGHRNTGAARLGWADGELVLRVQRGKVVAVEGIEPVRVGGRLGLEPLGFPDALQEARALAQRHGIPENRTVATVKDELQSGLRAWLLDPGRQLELVDAEAVEIDGPTISLTHALVEIVLASEDDAFSSAILPSLEVLLRRSPDFLELYAPLCLSEEADLIAAKITGQRTAAEIRARSPHAEDGVVRLMAALVGAGLLEAVPVAAPERPESEDLPTPAFETPPRRLRIPVLWLVVAAVAALLVVSVVGFVLTRPWSGQDAPTSSWGLAVDMGCEPEDFQRILRKASSSPGQLQAARADLGDGEPCWRLIWGGFSTQEEAEESIDQVPPAFLHEGFDPHAVELPETGPEGDESAP